MTTDATIANGAPSLLTVSEAADRMRVHPITIRRWIARGRLPAYRVGGSGLRIREDDLAGLIVPVAVEPSEESRVPSRELAPVSRLTPEQQGRGLQAIAAMRRLRADLLEANGGRLFPDSSETIREMREERTRQLMRASEE